MIDLTEILRHPEASYDCPNCGEDGGRKCVYGNIDREGEFECTHEDAENLECPCHETFCEKCRKNLPIVKDKFFKVWYTNFISSI